MSLTHEDCVKRAPGLPLAGSAAADGGRRAGDGLAADLEDRRRAAQDVLAEHPEWSDRRIGSLCGLSGKTVAGLRRQLSGPGPGGVVIGLDRRVGKDGKARPVSSEQVRERIRAALEENPYSSLRAVAALVGASPETVRSVRARMQSGRSAVTPIAPWAVVRPRPMEAFEDAEAGSDEERPPVWETDRALASCGDSGRFARWFSQSEVDEEWHDHVWSIPIGRVYEVVDEARRRAATWSRFASLLETRVRP